MNEEQVKRFWLATIGTDFSKPCCVCGKMPQVDDIWKVEIVAEEKREGHKACLEKKKPYSKPVLRKYGNIRDMTEASFMGSMHDGHHGRIHKTT